MASGITLRHDYQEAREFALNNAINGGEIGYDADHIAFRMRRYRHNKRDDILSISPYTYTIPGGKATLIDYDMTSGDYVASVPRDGSDYSISTIKLKNFEWVDFRHNLSENRVVGGKRDNTYFSGEYSDYFSGGDGDDTYLVTPAGWDKFEGGQGIDTIRMSDQYKLNHANYIDPEDPSVGTTLSFFGKNGVVTIHDDVEVIVKDGVRHSYESLFSRLRNDIRDAFNESTRETELIGSLVGDDMWGFLGRDIMTGMGGADYFHLTNSVVQACCE